MIAIGAGLTFAQDQDEAARKAALEQKFIQTMSHATLVGSFTTTGRGDNTKLRTERYTIGEVRKLQDNLFLFNARLQYGDKDLNVPLPLVVIWAGDTPVITLTNAQIPGAGKYTARVMIYENHYAGYWAGADHGGHLFGVIERAAPAAQP
jgi:hypothetical protein